MRAAQDQGWIGADALDHSLAHARAFGDVAGRRDGAWVDLGSGGGLPGLVLAAEGVGTSWVLVDAQLRRVRHLQIAVDGCDLADRVTVRHERAELFARGPQRGAIDVVVARSFGPPAIVAEVAAPLLRPGGVLVVSEPPGETHRWPKDGLEMLGMAPVEAVRTDAGRFVRIVSHAACPERFPRQPKAWRDRPLF